MRKALAGFGRVESVTNQNQGPQHKRVRAAHILFLALAVLCTLGLAWWQWTRFRSGSGTFQNLGYAFQWPMFGFFFVYAYRKYIEYENKLIDAKASADDPDFQFQLDQEEFGQQVTTIDESFLPPRPQIDIDTFNELNKPRRGTEDLGGLNTVGLDLPKGD
ncbi:hypothetical protein [Corynebacterium caspium]|uniref:hypothetical protein n=1 Tax=Corynebacterium caspium TaxID=234828 RepID=UPI000372B4F4|nr:hypothetical protein [Corynebacterium caspium]WKD58799.1 hypothetical protein CCASP_01915 [Corynebacterium caspium DSM 44850]